ncbi:hypothetical protein Zmor_014238 [Zophobas morio]|uniref:Uncharacterized protein n=1 Tax=Zophobas morio TaxID=2755281 RepID=A0AA38IGS0_9CUCU|nr:hypothetical protein Zmor_014238 [Zophobas morio]
MGLLLRKCRTLLQNQTDLSQLYRVKNDMFRNTKQNGFQTTLCKAAGLAATNSASTNIEAAVILDVLRKSCSLKCDLSRGVVDFRWELLVFSQINIKNACTFAKRAQVRTGYKTSAICTGHWRQVTRLRTSARVRCFKNIFISYLWDSGRNFALFL